MHITFNPAMLLACIAITSAELIPLDTQELVGNAVRRDYATTTYQPPSQPTSTDYNPFCYSNKVAAAGDTKAPFNKASCDLLLNTHLPNILGVNTDGMWDPKTTYRWDLGTTNAPHKAGECVLELYAGISASPSFKPSVFLDDAKDIAMDCPQYGGVRRLQSANSWWINLYSEA